MKRLGQSFMDTEVSVPFPHVAAVILGCVLGATQALNQTTFALSSSWHAYLGLGLILGAHLGVKTLVGEQFRDSLGIPAWAAQSITALVATGTAALGLLPVGGSTVVVVGRVVLATATTMLIALGFGPAASSSVAEAAKHRRAGKRGAATRAVRARTASK